MELMYAPREGDGAHHRADQRVKCFAPGPASTSRFKSNLYQICVKSKAGRNALRARVTIQRQIRMAAHERPLTPSEASPDVFTGGGTMMCSNIKLIWSSK